MKMEEGEEVADYLFKYHPYCIFNIFNMNQHSDQVQNPEKTTLIVGAGPSGLAAAKYALQAGIKPIILEQRSDIGGVWNPTDGYTWSTMTTNLSKYTCRFSDFPWPEGSAMFPTSRDFYSYMKKYAEHFNVLPHIRF